MQSAVCGGAYGAGTARRRELRAASSAQLRRCQWISWLLPGSACPKVAKAAACASGSSSACGGGGSVGPSWEAAATRIHPGRELRDLQMRRVEHILRDENMMAAQEVLELFYEFIAVRLPIVDGSDRWCLGMIVLEVKKFGEHIHPSSIG